MLDTSNCTLPHTHTIYLQIVNRCISPEKQYTYTSMYHLYLPTNNIGASGQWCFTSGYHFVVTFSNEEGLTTLKHIKNTSV